MWTSIFWLPSSTWKIKLQWILAYLNLFYPNAQFIRNKRAGYVMFTHHVCFKYVLTAVKMAASTCRKRMRVVLLLESKLSVLNRLAKGEKLLVNLVLAILQ